MPTYSATIIEVIASYKGRSQFLKKYVDGNFSFLCSIILVETFESAILESVKIESVGADRHPLEDPSIIFHFSIHM